jgi:hypothetical protein
MARNRYLSKSVISLAQQGFRLSAAYPQFKSTAGSRYRASWQGTLQPTELSNIYTVEISYILGRRPDIHVLDPHLQVHPDHKRLPHVYSGNSLCLYSFGEWYPGLYIANTIVPWISLWLFFYEIWIVTGNWKGGGTNPEWPQHREESCSSKQDFSVGALSHLLG